MAESGTWLAAPKAKGGARQKVTARQCYGCMQTLPWQGSDGQPLFSATQWRAEHDDRGKRRCFGCQRAEGVASSSLFSLQVADAVEAALLEERTAQSSARLLLTTSTSIPIHIRGAATVPIDAAIAEQFNGLYLDRSQEMWDEDTQTLPFRFDSTQRVVLQPFFDVAALSRDDNGYVLLSDGKHFRDKHGHELAGFTGYASVQSDVPASQRDSEQVRYIISFLPWSSWKGCWP